MTEAWDAQNRPSVLSFEFEAADAARQGEPALLLAALEGQIEGRSLALDDIRKVLKTAIDDLIRANRHEPPKGDAIDDDRYYMREDLATALTFMHQDAKSEDEILAALKEMKRVEKGYADVWRDAHLPAKPLPIEEELPSDS